VHYAIAWSATHWLARDATKDSWEIAARTSWVSSIDSFSSGRCLRARSAIRAVEQRKAEIFRECLVQRISATILG